MKNLSHLKKEKKGIMMEKMGSLINIHKVMKIRDILGNIMENMKKNKD